MIWSILFLLMPSMIPQSPAAPTPPFSSVQGAFFAVSVPDLDASTRWYTEKLGLSVVSTFPKQNKVAGALLVGGGLEVELMAHDDAAAPRDPSDIGSKVLTQGIMKAGFRVENLDRTVALMRERGVEIVLGPFPARRDHRANVLIRDNAGNLIQLFGDFAR